MSILISSFRKSLFVIVLSVLMSIISQQRAFAQRSMFSSASIDSLKYEIEEILHEYSIPGASVALVSKDSIEWLGGIGLANLKSNIPVTENTLFRVGSISKSITALGFAKLVESGVLDLNTPLHDLALEIEINNPWSETDPVRVVHLLEHTSGMDSDHFNEVFNLHDDPQIDLKDVLSINPGSRNIRWRPGTHVSYSNDGYALAGYILEKITGEKFEDFLEENVLLPLGMKNTYFKLEDAKTKNIASGYIDGESTPYQNYYLRPATSLFSTGEDLGLLVRFLLNRGAAGNESLLSEKSIIRMETPTTSIAAREGYSIGYGLGIRTGFSNGHLYFGHGGGLPDYNSLYAYIKELDLGCVVLINCSSDGFSSIVKKVMKFLIAGHQAKVAPAISLTNQELAKFTGYYEYCNSEREIDAMLNVALAGCTITLEDGVLYSEEFMSEKKKLIPVKPNQFRKEGQPVASIIFIETDQNEMLMAEPVYRSEYIRTGNWKPYTYWLLIPLMMFILLSSVVYAFIWIPAYFYKAILKKENKPAYPAMRIVPLSAVVALIAGFIGLAFSYDPVYEIGQFKFSTFLFFIGTIFFALLSLTSLYTTYHGCKKDVKTAAKIYAVILSFACVGMTLYLYTWDLIGLATWNY